ncbi:conserved hypothetical protein [Priestia megaterium]
MLVAYISFNIFVDIYYNPVNHFEKEENENDYFLFKLKCTFSISSL